MTIVRNVIEYLQILYDFPASQAAVIMAVTAFLYFLGCAAVPGEKEDDKGRSSIRTASVLLYLTGNRDYDFKQEYDRRSPI